MAHMNHMKTEHIGNLSLEVGTSSGIPNVGDYYSGPINSISDAQPGVLTQLQYILMPALVTLQKEISDFFIRYMLYDNFYNLI